MNVDAFGGDFIVDQTAAGGHPLHVAWQDRALVPVIVGMIDAALDDIGHGLDPSVWVLAENTAETNPPSALRTDPWLRSPRIAAGIGGLTRCCGVVLC